MAGVVYVKRGQELPRLGHSWFQTAPMHPLQGTAESLSQDGGILGKTYLRKGKMTDSNVSGEEKSMRKSPEDTKVKERRGGGDPGTRAKIPLQPVEKIMVEQVVPLQPMEEHGGTDIRTADPRVSHSRASGHVLKEASSCGGDPRLELVSCQELKPVRDQHWISQFLMYHKP